MNRVERRARRTKGGNRQYARVLARAAKTTVGRGRDRRKPLPSSPTVIGSPFILAILPVTLAVAPTLAAQRFAKVEEADPDAVRANLDAVHGAFVRLGQPPPPWLQSALQSARRESDAGRLAEVVQGALDPHCIAAVRIAAEGGLRATAADVPVALRQHGWTVCVFKVVNEAGWRSPLSMVSGSLLPVTTTPADQVWQRWLAVEAVTDPWPLRTLSGAGLEYRVVSLYSAVKGERRAAIAFDTGENVYRDGRLETVDLRFISAPATPIDLDLHNEAGEPTTVSLRITDALGRVYPAPAKRLSPDVWLQPQVYRWHGEQIVLAPGDYRVEIGRGPEYRTQVVELGVGSAPTALSARLERWIDPAAAGWWSGDHHVHARGCGIASNPTPGLSAGDVLRQALGEDLKITSVLASVDGEFGAGEFDGGVHRTQVPPYFLRYDVAVVGHGPAHAGGLCLLGLRQQHFAGDLVDWPTLGLTLLRWAKKQGAVCGTLHSGIGLGVPTVELPNDHMPRFDGTGANEFVVNVTHAVEGPMGEPVAAVDFVSCGSTPPTDELNIWYHTLNSGLRPRIAGGSAFPCRDAAVGGFRTYVYIGGDCTVPAWRAGLAAGRSYVSDGRAHLMDFAVDDLGVGGADVVLDRSGSVRVTLTAAALLPEEPDPLLAGRPCRRYGEHPHWHLERARIGGARRVAVEVVANGAVVGRREIEADGGRHELAFDVPIVESAWVAARIFGAAHTNPVWVTLDERPVAVAASAAWCLRAVDRCWAAKQMGYAEAERALAAEAYEQARRHYRAVVEAGTGR